MIFLNLSSPSFYMIFTKKNGSVIISTTRKSVYRNKIIIKSIVPTFFVTDRISESKKNRIIIQVNCKLVVSTIICTTYFKQYK